MEGLRFEIVPFGSDRYRAALDLRDRVLRQPLGLRIEDEDTTEEEGSLHFVALEHDHVVACLMVLPVEIMVDGRRTAKLRQVAVAPEKQRRGVGRHLLRFAEQELLDRKVDRLWMHARVDVLPFYLKAGYQLLGEPFEEIGIMHQGAEKLLS